MSTLLENTLVIEIPIINNLQPSYKIDDFFVVSKSDFIEENNLPIDHIHLLDAILLPFVFYSPKIPFVAGGFLRRWVQGEPLKDMNCDIDIYFQGPHTDTETRDMFKKYVETAFDIKAVETENGFHNTTANITMDEKSWELQLMHPSFNIHNYINDIKRHLNTYDSTSSMILYDHAKEQFIYHKDFLEHARNKIYNFNTNCRSVSPVTQLQRIKKFTKEGYSMTPESDKKFLKWISDNSSRIDIGDNYRQ